MSENDASFDLEKLKKDLQAAGISQWEYIRLLQQERDSLLDTLRPFAKFAEENYEFLTMYPDDHEIWNGITASDFLDAWSAIEDSKVAGDE